MTRHRIARQRVELLVSSEQAARELHDELSASLTRRVAPVLDDVFDEVCPAGDTIRLDAVEIDLGVVSRDELLDVVAEQARVQLLALLRAGGEQAETPRARVIGVQHLTRLDIALELVGTYLAGGAVTWRHAALRQMAIDESVSMLIDSAPAALLALLRRLEPTATARRVWLQLSEPARAQILTWLAGSGSGVIERVVAEWTALLVDDGWRAAPAAAGDTSSRTTVLASVTASLGAPAVRTRRDVAAWLFEAAWPAIVAGRSSDRALDRVHRRALATVAWRQRGGGVAAAIEQALAAAQRLLPASSLVLDQIGKELTRRSDPASSRRQRPGAIAGIESEQTAQVGASPAARVSDAARDDVDHEVGREPTESAADEATAVARVRARLDPSPAADSRAPRRYMPFETGEPVWAAHAGVVIAWPFLSGLFGHCGLVANKRFVDEAARARAVLLAAHLADGQEAWDEPELVVEKLLCGYGIEAPLDTTLAPTDRERQEVADLLGAILTHWTVLKSTSIAGLRAAFLCREGTATKIDSGWKLDIQRAGHDVLLDSLPWGIGLVVLPWMEQPLSVEW